MIDWQKLLLRDPLSWNEDDDGRRTPVKIELGPTNGKGILAALFGK